jgi:hypothetical protein
LDFSFLTPWVAGYAEAWCGKFGEGVDSARSRGLKSDERADGF